MSGRHAAADGVDDAARAEAEPDRPGAHRAADPPMPRKKPPASQPPATQPATTRKPASKTPSRAKRRTSRPTDT